MPEVTPQRISRVETQIDLIWGSRASFSRESGISETRLSRALDPDTATDRRLAPIERAIQDLRKSKNGVAEPITGYDVERYRALVHVPLVSVRASGGEGEEPFSEEVEAYVAYDQDQIRRDLGVDPSRLLVIPVVGDSMDPTLRAGERILVLEYQGEPIYDGGVYVFYGRYKGVLVKRVRWQQDGSMHLVGDNPETNGVIVIKPGDEPDWHVIGRVVRVEKSL